MSGPYRELPEPGEAPQLTVNEHCRPRYTVELQRMAAKVAQRLATQACELGDLAHSIDTSAVSVFVKSANCEMDVVTCIRLADSLRQQSRQLMERAAHASRLASGEIPFVIKQKDST
jgi:hypothetical protein